MVTLSKAKVIKVARKDREHKDYVAGLKMRKAALETYSKTIFLHVLKTMHCS